MVNHFDIGALLFREILQVSQYPGAPFSGQILNDIVLFFFIPTVFIILFTYFLLGMMFTPEQRGLRLLVGLAIYLFILFGGYFSVFALLAGPVFLWLIFGLGLLAFLARFLPGIGGGRGGPLRLKRGRKEAEIKLLRQRLKTLASKLEGAVSDNDQAKIDIYTKQIEETEDRLEELTGAKE